MQVARAALVWAMPIPLLVRRPAAWGAVLLSCFAVPLAAQHTRSARDSVELARQARLIAQLDSQLTALRHEVGARAADTARGGTPSGAAAAPTGLAGVRVGGLLQVWYAQGDGGFQSTFRLRRAEVKLTGDLSARARWALTVDAARALATTTTTADVNGTTVVTSAGINQGSRILTDAYIALTLPARLELDVGQSKIPLGLEGGVQSPATLETVERSLFSSDRTRGGIYGDARDIGVLLRAPAGHDVDLSVGVFNGVGESQNDTDHNGAKAVTGRVVARIPFVRMLAVGASGALGTTNAPDSVVRRRAGIEARFVAGPVMLKSEYMAGRDGARRGAGWYAHAGYSATPRLNLVVRRDVFDPDLNRETSLADARERDWVGGFSYDVPVMAVRFQMNYLRKTFPAAIASPRDLLLTNLQAAW